MEKKITIKTRHNKKRNTLFLYEALMKEITACILGKDEMRKAMIVSIFKEHFRKGTLLKSEIDIYHGLLESTDLSRNLAEKIIVESKKQHALLNKDKIFEEQTNLIDTINRKLSPAVFSNFVANYKNLATIAQLFSNTLPAKSRVILEQIVIGKMCSKSEDVAEERMKPLDDLVYKTYIRKFNEKYGNNLLKEQKDLLTHYVMSFSDGGSSLKFFLNEEIFRIKKSLLETTKKKEISEDATLSEMTKRLSLKLESFKTKNLDQEMLGEILKIQQFVAEAQKNV